MVNLSPNICFRIREARRAAKLSQGEVSAEVGCRQSALSMFEQGDGTKLNEEVIKKLADKFSIDLYEPAIASKAGNSRAEHLSVGETGRGFCPNPNCPSNQAFEVDGRRLYRPDRHTADPVGGRYCAICGEALERKCPNCGARIHEGAVCSFCGEPYIASAS